MSASNSQRVGEIFKTAGTAFNTLGHLTSQLESSGQNASKWTDQEINMLARAVQTFATDLQSISDAIKGRTVTQIKGTLQKKAFDEAGIIVQQQVQSASQVVSVQNNTQQPVQPPCNKQPHGSEVTLNALNAEVDVEGSLDFDSTTPDV